MLPACPRAGVGGRLGGGGQYTAGVGPGEGRTVDSLLVALVPSTFRDCTTCTTCSSLYISGNFNTGNPTSEGERQVESPVEGGLLGGPQRLTVLVGA